MSKTMKNFLEKVRATAAKTSTRPDGQDPPHRLTLADLRQIQKEVGEEFADEIAGDLWNDWVSQNEREIDAWCRKTAPDIRRLRANSLTPTLVDRKGVAAILGVGVRTVDRMNASEAIPTPIRIGRLVKWRRSEIIAWAAEECPSRRRWEAIKRQRRLKF